MAENRDNLALFEETPSPPPELLVTGHFTEAYGYKATRLHGSGNWLLTYTVQGQGVFRLREKLFYVGAGDAILLAPTTPHDYRTASEQELWEFSWAHFQTRITWHEWLALPEIEPGLFYLHLDSPEMRQRVETAFWQTHADTHRRDLAALNHLSWEGWEADPWKPLPTLEHEFALNSLERVLLLLAHAYTQKPKRSFDPRVQQILTHITANLAAPHTLESLAAEVALSPSRLVHLFRRETGRTIVQTLHMIRLYRARILLETTTDTLAHIAHTVGFPDASYFSRLFRQSFGQSPGSYRQSFIEQHQRKFL